VTRCSTSLLRGNQQGRVDDEGSHTGRVLWPRGVPDGFASVDASQCLRYAVQPVRGSPREQIRASTS
jgi:hypothetical protein